LLESIERKQNISPDDGDFIDEPVSHGAQILLPSILLAFLLLRGSEVIEFLEECTQGLNVVVSMVLFKAVDTQQSLVEALLVHAYPIQPLLHMPCLRTAQVSQHIISPDHQ